MGMKSKSAHFGSGAGGPSTKLGKSPVKNKGDKSCKSKQKIFDERGHVTFNSISSRREFFLGKSVARLEHELNKHGYKTTRKASIHRGSKAKFIVTLNSTKERNVTQIQISPGSKRHGNVPYVKISTSDLGRIKIIGSDPKSYKTDGKENAKFLFRRKKQ